MPSHYINLTAAALKILKEYRQNADNILKATAVQEELHSKILADLYALDNAYFSLNRKYQQDTVTFDEFCKKHNLHRGLKEIFPNFQKEYGNLYVHQVQAIESILSGKTTIIATGTGSGKTETFLIPILDHCLKNKGKNGIKAIILYPMNALANDQLRRIKEGDTVKNLGISVGSFIGSTSKEARAEMIDHPPDILVTNFVMLDRLITKEERSMFVRATDTLRYLVVDEIHYYRGAKGANLSLLLRRLRTLCADKSQLVQIGASATLQQGGEYYRNQDRSQIENFTRTIFSLSNSHHFSG